MLLCFIISSDSLVVPAALLAALAVRIEFSPAPLKKEGFVGETLTSRSDRAVGLPRVVDMVLLVMKIGVWGRDEWGAALWRVWCLQ